MRRNASLLSSLLMFAAVAVADDAALARCRQIAVSAQRLACYDAIELEPASGAAAAPASRPLAERFGLDKLFREGEPDAVDSHINGDFDGWRPNQRITLANGQVWQVIDGTDGVVGARSPKVKVRRGALGAYYLDIMGINFSPRVRRVECAQQRAAALLARLAMARARAVMARDPDAVGARPDRRSRSCCGRDETAVCGKLRPLHATHWE